MHSHKGPLKAVRARSVRALPGVCLVKNKLLLCGEQLRTIKKTQNTALIKTPNKLDGNFVFQGNHST